jgi:hypothetical protein
MAFLITLSKVLFLKEEDRERDWANEAAAPADASAQYS